MEAGVAVAEALREQQPHQRLQTGDEQSAGLEPVPVIQPCNLAQLHTTLDRSPSRSTFWTRHYGLSARWCLTFCRGDRASHVIPLDTPEDRPWGSAAHTLKRRRSRERHATLGRRDRK